MYVTLSPFYSPLKEWIERIRIFAIYFSTGIM